MSDVRMPREHEEQESVESQAPVMARLLPLISFGLGAAALAGLLLPAGAAAAGMGGGLEQLTVPSNTTCCP